jgi:hypothetical protein
MCGRKMLTQTEENEVEGHTAMRKTLRTDRGRTLIIRGASSEQGKKIAEAYIWILQNFMPEFGEIKGGEKQSKPVAK